MSKWETENHFAHIVSGFAENRGRGHDIDTVDPGQICTGQAKQPFAQVEPRLVRPLLLEPSLALLFRQAGTMTAVLSMFTILVELAITLSHLLLTKLISILLLLQHKQ